MLRTSSSRIAHSSRRLLRAFGQRHAFVRNSNIQPASTALHHSLPFFASHENSTAELNGVATCKEDGERSISTNFLLRPRAKSKKTEVRRKSTAAAPAQEISEGIDETAPLVNQQQQTEPTRKRGRHPINGTAVVKPAADRRRGRPPKVDGIAKKAATVAIDEPYAPEENNVAMPVESQADIAARDAWNASFSAKEVSVGKGIAADNVPPELIIPTPNEDALAWTRDFGRRSAEYERHLETITKLRPGDEGYFDVSDPALVPAGVTVVRTPEEARTVLEQLNKAPADTIHACDTEVMDIDLKQVGPVGNGYVTCLTVFSGPDFDYGLGRGLGTSLFIDNLDDSHGILQYFKDWLEDGKVLKVWHNYGFDRHVLWNEGINCRGLAGDTMHMARLTDTHRETTGAGYSLEALTRDYVKRVKKPMKELFGKPRLRKDGTAGKVLDLPPVEELQRNPATRPTWIDYACYDAKGTWLLHEALRRRLLQTHWMEDEKTGKKYGLYAYYWEYMRPFAVVLTDMERRGIRVNARDYLRGVEVQARKDRDKHSRIFREWAARQFDDGIAINPASSAQMQTFLFGGATNAKTGELTEETRVFSVPRSEVPEEALEAFRLREERARNGTEDDEQDLAFLNEMTGVQLRSLAKEQGLSLKGKKDELVDRLREHFMTTPPGGGTVAAGPAEEDSLAYLYELKVVDLKALCKENGLKVGGKKADLQERLREHFQQQQDGGDDDDINGMSDQDLRDTLIARSIAVPDGATRKELVKMLREDEEFTSDLLNAAGPAADDSDSQVELSRILEQGPANSSLLQEYLQEIREKKNKVPRNIDITIKSLGLEPSKFTAGGGPSVTADVLKKLAGDPFADPPKYGTALEPLGEEACKALYSLCQIGSIDTMIANFLTSLQDLADNDSRVHCSLNLNTATGRLSSRRPNLQNQPALEKDVYKIRKAFEASPGNSLIVADYGQLELRILASITNCKAMIEAFAEGGDFHSRTAVDMNDYIQQDIAAGTCLLEKGDGGGDDSIPLVKDKYASERRKAKVLNFSIAYGKTAHGLSLDFGVSKEEAEEQLRKWYDARPEVREWQADRKETARRLGITRTLMGRYRQLPEAMAGNRAKQRGHAERASINTPIQGGAADIAMMAMLKINRSPLLKKLGWVLLLQIHDEVILEGPEESAEEAYAEVVKCMEEPWVFGLEEMAVPLVVDGSYTHKTWYDAK